VCVCVCVCSVMKYLGCLGLEESGHACFLALEELEILRCDNTNTDITGRALRVKRCQHDVLWVDMGCFVLYIVGIKHVSQT